MKQKKNTRKNGNISLGAIKSLLFILESAELALSKGNFNLAEVWMTDYFDKLPQSFMDQTTVKPIYHALEQRSVPFLKAAIDSEIERVRTEKVKALREEIVT